MTYPDSSRAADLDFLRGLSTEDIARMAWMLLPAALEGHAGAPSLTALRLMGTVLSERESTDRKTAA